MNCKLTTFCCCCRTNNIFEKLESPCVNIGLEEPSFENDEDEQTPTASTADVSIKSETTKKNPSKTETNNNINNNNCANNNNGEPKTPSDQLRMFLDAIRHNQSIETHQRTDVPKTIPESQVG